MARAEIKDLDHSAEMRAYFETIMQLLIDEHHFSRDAARSAADRFFAMDVDPVERVFTMHTDAHYVAEDHARSS